MTTVGSQPTVEGTATVGERGVLQISDLSIEHLVELLDPDAPTRRLDGSYVVDIPPVQNHLRTAFHEAVAEAGGRVVVSDWPALWTDRTNPLGDRLRPPLRAAAISSDQHEQLVQYRRRSRVPIINAGSDRHQPTVVLADLLTLRELLGKLRGITIAYVGPANGYRTSLIQAAARTGIDLSVYAPDRDATLVTELDAARPYAACFGSSLTLIDPTRAVVDVDAVIGEPLPFALLATRTHLPVAMTGTAADSGASTIEGPRSLLFHRQENLHRMARRLLSLVS